MCEMYYWCMSRTNIDLDDEACQVVMHRFNLTSKRDAVNYALRLLAVEPMDLERARAMRGSGWEGDLNEMRGSRVR
jgi:Arc/MetJ family transcription regulator